jgi:hypothetical protein
MAAVAGGSSRWSNHMEGGFWNGRLFGGRSPHERRSRLRVTGMW